MTSATPEESQAEANVEEEEAAPQDVEAESEQPAEPAPPPAPKDEQPAQAEVGQNRKLLDVSSFPAPPEHSTYLLEELRVKTSRLISGGRAWVKVADAARLFEIGRKEEKFKTTGRVVINGDDNVVVLEVNFEENEIHVDMNNCNDEPSTQPAGAMVTNLGAAPGWKWLKGKGGYDLQYECFNIYNSHSQVMLEVAYGAIRLKAGPQQRVQFVAYDGTIEEDLDGVSWARFVRTGKCPQYEESWFSPKTAHEMVKVDQQRPNGMGNPFPAEGFRAGCWEGSVTSKGMILFKNFNSGYYLENDENKYPITLMLNPDGLVFFISKGQDCVLVHNGVIETMTKEEGLPFARKFWKLKLPEANANYKKKQRAAEEEKAAQAKKGGTAGRTPSQSTPPRTASRTPSR